MSRYALFIVLLVLFACTDSNKTPKEYYYSIAFDSGTKTAQYSNVFSSTCSDAELTNLAKSEAEKMGFPEFKLQGPYGSKGDGLKEKEDSKKAFQGTGFKIGADFTFPACP